MNIDDDWTHNGIINHDCFISSAAASSDCDIGLQLSSFDQIETYNPDKLISIKMEPDETSDYHGSSSGSPSSSLSSPHNIKDEPLALDINFGGPFTNTNFSPAQSSESPIFMMHSGQISQQHSPLPPVGNFSHSHMPSPQALIPSMQHYNAMHLGPLHNHHSNNSMLNNSMYYEGIGCEMNAFCTATVVVKEEIKEEIFDQEYGEQKFSIKWGSEDEQLSSSQGGLGLAAAQQQLKSRSKMHEMAVKQKLITDQNTQSNGDVQLSAEERKTLIQEGYSIPSRLPLTKNEEEALKIVRRKIKNKLSAQESRRKRKEYLDALEIRVQGCVQENNFLKSRIRQLEQQNRDLIAKVQSYEDGHNAIMMNVCKQ